jgi:hypothetical protein
LVLGVQARANCGVVEDRDVGGDQCDGFQVGEQDGQVGAQQLSRGSGCGVWGVVVLDVGVDAVQEGTEQMAGRQFRVKSARSPYRPCVLTLGREDGSG